MKTPTAGPKTRRGAVTVGGAVTIVLGWIVGDVLGYDVPVHVMQAFTVIAVAVLAEWGIGDATDNRGGSADGAGRVRDDRGEE